VPLLFACMCCGQRVRLLPEQTIRELGWWYDELLGWMCGVCRDLPGRLKRRPGHPQKS
jgi:hypothetical protein